MAKRLSVVAIHTLKEALCNIFWYKKDLYSFFRNCIRDKSIISLINCGSYKREMVSEVVDALCEDQDKYLGDLRRLMHEVCQMKNFAYLEKLEDGQKKAHKASEAVQALRELVESHDKSVKEKAEIAKRRKDSLEKQRINHSIVLRLEEIKEIYKRLVISTDYQRRGYELEKVLYDLFSLYDLDPKASFRNIGEQIDGAFTLDGTDYLFEAKWTEHQLGSDVLDSFKGKVGRKLDNTLGLFLSINGFSRDAINLHSAGRSTILLMDGMDLMAVLDGRIGFDLLLTFKRRHAAQTGKVFYRVTEYL